MFLTMKQFLMVKFHFFADIIARIGSRKKRERLRKNTVADVNLIYWPYVSKKKIY